MYLYLGSTILADITIAACLCFTLHTSKCGFLSCVRRSTVSDI